MRTVRFYLILVMGLIGSFVSFSNNGLAQNSLDSVGALVSGEGDIGGKSIFAPSINSSNKSLNETFGGEDGVRKKAEGLTPKQGGTTSSVYDLEMSGNINFTGSLSAPLHVGTRTDGASIGSFNEWGQSNFFAVKAFKNSSSLGMGVGPIPSDNSNASSASDVLVSNNLFDSFGMAGAANTFAASNEAGSPGEYALIITDNMPLFLASYLGDDIGYRGIAIYPDGNALINCNLHAQEIVAKEIKVDLDGADFVFEDDYELRTLEAVEQYIDENKHLPDIPSAKEIETERVGLGGMQTKLLQKIEELTLYAIEQDKRMAEQAKRIEELEKIFSRQ